MGFSPFAVDRLSPDDALGNHYRILRALTPLILEHKGRETMRGFLQYRPANETGAELTLGDLRVSITYPGDVKMPIGGGLVIRTGPSRVIMAAARCSVQIASTTDPAVRILSANECKSDQSLLVPIRELECPGGQVLFGNTPQLVEIQIGSSGGMAQEASCPAWEEGGAAPTLSPAQQESVNGMILSLAAGSDQPMPVALASDEALAAEREVLEALRPMVGRSANDSLATFIQDDGQEHAELNVGNCRMSVDFPSGRGQPPGCGMVIRLDDETLLVAGTRAVLRVIPRPDGIGPAQIYGIETLHAAGGEFRAERSRGGNNPAVNLESRLGAVRVSTASRQPGSLKGEHHVLAMRYLQTLAGEPDAPLPPSMSGTPAFAEFREMVAALRPELRKRHRDAGSVATVINPDDANPVLCGGMELKISHEAMRTQPTGALIVAVDPGTCLIAGSGVKVGFRSPDDTVLAKILSKEELIAKDGIFTAGRLLNGDEFFAALDGKIQCYRFKTYTIPARP